MHISKEHFESKAESSVSSSSSSKATDAVAEGLSQVSVASLKGHFEANSGAEKRKADVGQDPA